MQETHVDYDLALFTTYSQTLKQTMRSVFQSILYRLYRESRIDISALDFSKAIDKLAFKKEDSLPLGLLMKSMLMRSNDLTKPYGGSKTNGSIYAEFGISEADFDDCLKNCILLWERVTSITQLLQKNNGFTPELVQQFKAADEFFKAKIKNVGKAHLLNNDD